MRGGSGSGDFLRCRRTRGGKSWLGLSHPPAHEGSRVFAAFSAALFLQIAKARRRGRGDRGKDGRAGGWAQERSPLRRAGVALKA